MSDEEDDDDQPVRESAQIVLSRAIYGMLCHGCHDRVATDYRVKTTIRAIGLLVRDLAEESPVLSASQDAMDKFYDDLDCLCNKLFHDVQDFVVEYCLDNRADD